MKVKAKILKKRRAKNSRNPWYGVKEMNDYEAQGAKKAIIAILKRHQNGLSYVDKSMEEALLEKVEQRSKFGDKQRQLLIFQSVLHELIRLNAVVFDPIRRRLSYNTNTMLK